MTDPTRFSASGERLQSDAGLRRQIAALQGELAAKQHEAQRRLRNMLAMIRSIIRRTSDDTTNLENYRLRLEGRIAAFTRVQALLLSDQENGIGLFSLVADERLLAGLDDRAIETRGDDIAICPAAANLLVLLIHELVQGLSANKRAAFPLAVLHVVSANLYRDGAITIEWTERDDEISARASRIPPWLDDALTYELNAEIKSAADDASVGWRYRIPARLLLSNAGFRERFPDARPGSSARN